MHRNKKNKKIDLEKDELFENYLKLETCIDLSQLTLFIMIKNYKYA